MILVAGALHLDMIVDAPHLPAADETVTGTAVAYRLGGKGANQAVAAARLGARVVIAGCVGSDTFAEDLLAGLDAAGVDRTRVRQVPGASGMSVATVAADGSYGAVIVSAANLAFDGDVVLPAGLRVLVLQNEVPAAANAALVARMPPQVAVILNAAPARPVDPALWRRLDVVVVNRVEAAVLGPAPADLCAHGPKAAIVTLGAGGLAGLDRGVPFTQPGFPVPVVSTHGAGDAFVGALALRLAEGAPLPEAARFAQAAAALTVATPPGRRGDLNRVAVEGFLEAGESTGDVF